MENTHVILISLVKTITTKIWNGENLTSEIHSTLNYNIILFLIVNKNQHLKQTHSSNVFGFPFPVTPTINISLFTYSQVSIYNSKFIKFVYIKTFF